MWQNITKGGLYYKHIYIRRQQYEKSDIIHDFVLRAVFVLPCQRVCRRRTDGAACADGLYFLGLIQGYSAGGQDFWS